MSMIDAAIMDKEALKSQCSCDFCGLFSGRRNPFIPGRLADPNASLDDVKYIVIGEAPGKYEDEKGYCFAGFSGSTLETAFGEDFSSVYLTNICRCVPWGDKDAGKVRQPTNDEMKSCGSWIKKELSYFPDNITVILCGNTALSFFFPENKGITAEAGIPRILELDNKKSFLCVPNFHPAAIGYNPKYSKQFHDIINRVCAGITMEYEPDPNTKILHPQQGISYLDKVIKLHSAGKIQYIIYDSETTSLSPQKGKMIMLGFCDTHYRKGVTIPTFIQNTIHPDWKGGTIPIDMEISPSDISKLQYKTRELFAKVPIVGHNLKFDIQFASFHQYMDINKVHVYNDTLALMSVLIGREWEGDSLSLKESAHRVCGVDLWEGEIEQYLSLYRLVADRHFGQIPTCILYKYCGRDVYHNMLLHEALYPRIEKQKTQLVIDNLNRCTEFFSRSELLGIQIDQKLYEDIKANSDTALDNLEKQIKKDPKIKQIMKERYEADLEENAKKISPKTGKPTRAWKDPLVFKDKFLKGEYFSITSPIDKVLFFESHNVTPVIMTNKNKMATNKEAIEEIMTRYADNPYIVRFCSLIADYNKFAKLKSAYIDGLYENVWEHDSRFHPSFNICGCITKDSLIPTSEGLKYIDSFISPSAQHGEFIPRQTTIVNLNSEPEETSHVVRYDNQPVISITTRSGFTLAGTHCHPVLSNVYPYSAIKTNSHRKQTLNNPENSVWTPLSFIVENESLVKIPVGTRIFGDFLLTIPDSFSHATYPRQMNEDLALFIGAVVSCGQYITQTNSLFFYHRDETVLSFISSLIKSLFNLPSKIHYHKGGYPELHSSSVFWRDFIPFLDLNFKRHEKFIHSYILQAPENIQIAYLRGIFLKGYAYINNKLKNKSFDFLSVSYRFLKELQLVLLNMGILSRVRTDDRRRERLSYRLYPSIDGYRKIRDSIGFIHTEKIIPDSKLGNFKPTPDFIWDRVVKISHSTETVFDFTVPDSHSFVSNGIISHNTVTGRMCLIEGTLIANPTGEDKPIDSYSPGDYLPVYSYSPELNEIVHAPAIALGHTRTETQAIRVTFDDSHQEVCTIDHPWLIHNGTYKRADELTEGDFLLSFFRKDNPIVCMQGVQKVELLTFEQPMKFYDLEVPAHSNFALASGVIVHNSSGFHTIPKASSIKRLFISRWADEGGLFSGSDMSQLELRTTAAIAVEESWIQAYREDKDLHQLTAANMFKIPFEDVTKAQRNIGKTQNFSILYGSSAESQAKKLGITVDEAKKLLETYRTTIPQVMKLIERQQNVAKAKGYIISMFNRFMPVPDALKKDRGKQGHGLRQSFNFLIQSAGSDLVTSALVAMFTEVRKRGMKTELIGAVHDSVEIDMYPGEAIAIYNLIKFYFETWLMDKFTWLKCPVRIDLDMGTSWGSCIEMDKPVLTDHSIEFEGSGFKQDIIKLAEQARKAYNFDYEVLNIKELSSKDFSILDLVTDTEKWTVKAVISNK